MAESVEAPGWQGATKPGLQLNRNEASREAVTGQSIRHREGLVPERAP